MTWHPLSRRPLLRWVWPVAAALTFVFQMTMTIAAEPTHEPELTAARVAAPPTLDDEVWADIAGQSLVLHGMDRRRGRTVQEAGETRLAWDDEALYLLVRFADEQVVNRATADFEELYLTGDLAEWFVGPADAEWYIELHVSPSGHRAAYFFPFQPRDFERGLDDRRTLEDLPFSAEIEVDGTLNEREGVDGGWSAMITLPWDTLREHDPEAGPDTAWTTLVARYNYGQNINRRRGGRLELTTYPSLPWANFHLRRHHAPMRLLPAGETTP